MKISQHFRFYIKYSTFFILQYAKCLFTNMPREAIEYVKAILLVEKNTNVAGT